MYIYICIYTLRAAPFRACAFPYTYKSIYLSIYMDINTDIYQSINLFPSTYMYK